MDMDSPLSGQESPGTSIVLCPIDLRRKDRLTDRWVGVLGADREEAATRY